jgi:hypothetical protein
MDEIFKDTFSNWATKNGRGRVSRGNVMGGKKGISCRCNSTGRQIKIVDDKIKIQTEEHEYDDIKIENDLLIIQKDDKSLVLEGKDFFSK